MAQQLRALAALPEDMGSVPRTHIVAHKWLKIQVQGIQHSLLAFMGTRYTARIDMHAGKTHIHMKY